MNTPRLRCAGPAPLWLVALLLSSLPCLSTAAAQAAPARWTRYPAHQPTVEAERFEKGVCVSPETRLSTSDEAWWDGFNGPGMSAQVNAITEWNGLLVVGGWFMFAGPLRASGIAAFDGHTWSTLGGGMNDEVTALAVYQGDLIAGGKFTEAGGVAAHHVARWDGTQWLPLGPGLEGTAAFAFANYRDELIAGGSFFAAGGNPAEQIARWNGVSWAPLGDGVAGGLDPWVRDLLVHDDKLVAAGNFTRAGGATAVHVAEWDGASWSPKGVGVIESAEALAVFNGDLIIAGWGGYVTRLGGNFWRPLQGALPNTPNIYRLFVEGDHLLAGGGYREFAVVHSWNGSTWSELEPLHWLSGAASVRTMATYQGSLFVGGSFGRSITGHVLRLARRDGSSWAAVVEGNGLNDDPAEAFAAFNGKLIAGGWFEYAGANHYDHIAAWDGSSWSPLGAGLNNRVTAVATYGDGLVAGGYFDQAGGAQANHIASWDGTKWSALGTGLPGPIYAMLGQGDDLVAGGWRSDSLPEGVVARWDRNQWSELGQGMDGGITSLAAYGGKLVAGGLFTMADGNAANGIAYWDGDAWRAFPEGHPAPVLSMTLYDGRLIAGGWGGVAAWDGMMWTPMGDPPDTGSFQVAALATLNGTLYIGGRFFGDLQPFPKNIASWDGDTWQPLGLGTDGTVWALSPFGGSLYAGGTFFGAGGHWSNAIARWDGTLVPVEVTDFEARSHDATAVLTWRHSAESVERVATVRVERAQDASGPYELITSEGLAPERQMVFEDTDPPVAPQVWYRLALELKSGTRSYTQPINLYNSGGGGGTNFLRATETSEGLVRIAFYRSQPETIRISIFDVRGRRVWEHGPIRFNRGSHVLVWDRGDRRGGRVGRGVYILELQTGNTSVTTKIPLTKN